MLWNYWVSIIITEKEKQWAIWQFSSKEQIQETLYLFNLSIYILSILKISKNICVYISLVNDMPVKMSTVYFAIINKIEKNIYQHQQTVVYSVRCNQKWW